MGIKQRSIYCRWAFIYWLWNIGSTKPSSTTSSTSTALWALGTWQVDVDDDGGIVVLYTRCFVDNGDGGTIVLFASGGGWKGTNADRKWEQFWFRFWGSFCWSSEWLHQWFTDFPSIRAKAWDSWIVIDRQADRHRLRVVHLTLGCSWGRGRFPSQPGKVLSSSKISKLGNRLLVWFWSFQAIVDNGWKGSYRVELPFEWSFFFK